jgi:hypothetical protein
VETFTPALLVAALAGIGSLICWVIILVAAFRDEVWKGFVCLLCGFYFLYYALAEYDEDNKWTLISIMLLCWVVGAAARVAIGAPR